MKKSALVPHSPLSKRHLEPFELGTHLSEFTAQMTAAGYATHTIKSYTDSISHFGTWLKMNSISVHEVTPCIVERFSTHHCLCPGGRKKNSVSKKYARRVSRFVDYLQESGVLDFKLSPIHTPAPCWDKVGFTRWLFNDLGLTEVTISNYVRYLTQVLPDLGYDTEQYCAQSIRDVVCHYADAKGINNAKRLTSALSAYLKYLVSEDLCSSALIAAIPTLAQWQLTNLPRYISMDEIRQVIESCDVELPAGMRDHAVLLLLARLGLRAADIVNLQISDIDWNKATLRVSGKTRKQALLPLPQDTGDAILRYLSKGRDNSTGYGQLFLRVTAPHTPLSGGQSVAHIVRSAIKRSGIPTPPSAGAHLLRHSAATGWIRDGASLESVSTILRHGGANMTMRYAKTDINALDQLAIEWPENTL